MTMPLPSTQVLSGMNDPRRQKPQNKGFIADINAVPGIMAALVTRNNIKPVRQQIDDLSLSFIAPLGADNYNYHIKYFFPFSIDLSPII